MDYTSIRHSNLYTQTDYNIKKIVDLYAHMGHTRPMKTDLLKVRITPHEKDAFQEAADLAGLSLSSWARERLRRVVIRELEDASRPIPFIGKERS
jgi:hypothetical protein